MRIRGVRDTVDMDHGRGVTGLAACAGVIALMAAGCGGTRHAAAPPSPPKLPRALAQSWAQQADAIAAALAAGDGCTAEARAVALRTEVVQAVNARNIPRRYLEPLSGTVNDLPNRISCNPAPTPGNSKYGHKQKDKHENGGD